MLCLIRKDQLKIKVSCRIFMNSEKEALRKLFMDEFSKHIDKILRYNSIITMILLTQSDFKMIQNKLKSTTILLMAKKI